jgi:hypothetical protein
MDRMGFVLSWVFVAKNRRLSSPVIFLRTFMPWNASRILCHTVSGNDQLADDEIFVYAARGVRRRSRFVDEENVQAAIMLRRANRTTRPT